jgi:DNA-binding XRE family transcriptional regulator
MALDVRRWRVRGGLTQVEAAQALGVSQTYLSLIERGRRPLTSELSLRLKRLPRGSVWNSQAATDREFQVALADLGYPPFAHLKESRRQVDPATLLLRALLQPDVDARVTEGLPWVSANYQASVDWDWMVRQAKLSNLQNRLGFLLDLSLAMVRRGISGGAGAPFEQARSDLDEARLLNEASFCWDSMPEATRGWMRANRGPEAQHWNVVTRLRSEDLPYV